MTKVALKQRLNAPADKVWELVGGFNNLPEFDPTSRWSILESGGRDRRVGVTGGGEIVERLLHFDERAHAYSYTITELIGLEFPFTNYLSTVSVAEDRPDQSCVLHWEGSGDPLPGKTDKDVETELTAIYEGIFGELRKRFGA
jgi:hypothetical protein